MILPSSEGSVASTVRGLAANSHRSLSKMARRLLALAAATISVSQAAAQAPVPSKPNIVIILADDLGYSDLGCYGSEISTPNIDQLAKDGVRLTQFYNCARCCPSRAALLTGMYPHQVGVGAMIDPYARPIRVAANRPSYQDHLRGDVPTLPQVLHHAGYRTLMSGKWHLGYRPEDWPVKRGFDRSFVQIPGAMNYFGGASVGPRSLMAQDDKEWVPPVKGFYSTDAFTDHAIEYVTDAKKNNEPFFLYLAYNAPHWPLQAPPEEIEKYKGMYDAGWQATRVKRMAKMVELGIVPAETKMAPMDRGKLAPWNQLNEEAKREWAQRMTIFAAQVSRMDKNVGRFLATLDSLGVSDNTLVLFLSDNGGAAEDPHRGDADAVLGDRNSFWGYDRPWASVSNTPWRLHKVTAYEGGISSPFIARWPARIPKEADGKMMREPAHIIDLMPTLLEITGANYLAAGERHLEGQSILPMILGRPGTADRTLCWEHEGNRAIRKGQWKLVTLGSGKEWELFDINADRSESHNIAAEHPDIVRELSSQYDQWAQRCGVMPWSEYLSKTKKK